ncbi:hypothetical protein AB6A40_004537 [Gnathostoma spinigerum]|uniref:Vacuolar protein sorting-associated protein 45 n=1 Tax=Gnathostoma spinigerum TaxID=75299 RepID=A0ABD6ECS5_9BILA
MDIVTAARQYISEMIRLAGPGIKVLLMDKETTSTVSCVYSQSDVMQKEVYLFERIDSGVVREPIKHLKCIVFIRPTKENIQLLKEELRSPCYSQYYIYFCNIISKTDVKILAEADEQESVREVHEFFLDGIPLAPHLLSLNIVSCYGPSFSILPSCFNRCVQSIIAALLSVKKRPVIRYQASNRDTKRLAEEVSRTVVREEALFENSRNDALLLIIDRSEDPVTPLLNQWTYEAMVHELLGINNQKVKMLSSGDAGTVLLSPLYDAFYAKNMYTNFGDFGQNMKELMSEFQKKSQTNQKLESIADMKNFIEQYPEFKKISGTVSKHVSVMGELSRLVSARHLLEVSEVEQQLAADGEHSQCLNAVRKLVELDSVDPLNACRLVMLYALRFETHVNNDIAGLVQLLRRKDFNSRNIVKAVLDFGGAARRQNDLFGGSAMAMTKRFIKGLKGVENIYTQHEPYITELLDAIIKNRLSEQQYPFLTPSMGSRVDNIMIFVVGGTTYEESRAVHVFNERRQMSLNSPRVLLLSTTVLNTRSFIDQLISQSH